MRYISTRGSAPVLDFRGATLAGLASDGGLYVPEAWPSLTPEEIEALAGLSYAQTAAKIMTPFVGDSLTPEELQELCDAAYGRFSHAAVTPLVQLDHDQWLLAPPSPSRTWRCRCWGCCSNASCAVPRRA